jgi:hypothetical protein
VFLNEAAVTPGESAVVIFCDFDSAAHVGLIPFILIFHACHDYISKMWDSGTLIEILPGNPSLHVA